MVNDFELTGNDFDATAETIAMRRNFLGDCTLADAETDVSGRRYKSGCVFSFVSPTN